VAHAHVSVAAVFAGRRRLPAEFVGDERRATALAGPRVARRDPLPFGLAQPGDDGRALPKVRFARPPSKVPHERVLPAESPRRPRLHARGAQFVVGHVAPAQRRRRDGRPRERAGRYRVERGVVARHALARSPITFNLSARRNPNSPPARRGGVQRSTLVTLGVALLCCLALAFAAAGLPNPQSTDGVAGNETQGDGSLIEDPDPPQSTAVDISVPTWLQRLFTALVVVGFVIGIVAFLEHPLQTLRQVVMVIIPLALLALLLYALSLLSGDPGGDSGGMGEPTTAPQGSSTDPVSIGFDPALMGVAVVVVVLVAVLLARRFGAGSGVLGTATENQAEDAADGAPAEVGHIAGRAADRIEGADASAVDNEVYRAWREMTTHLDVDAPASSTPAEFADAAVAAGVDEADAAELTALFRGVRYGGEEPTPEREERAVAVLRRIESAYGDEPAS